MNKLASTPSSGASPEPSRAGRLTWLADSAWLLAIAVAFRLPGLDLFPRYTDEVKEIMWALRIYWGEHLPLAAHNGYSGPLWNYVLATAFYIFGPSIALPRGVALALGSVTVVLTYALARTLGGRLAGVVAGLLLATSYIPVLLNSHVAWSACVLPLFSTAALLTAQVALRRASGAAWIATGLLVAAAVQVHPVGVLLVPSLALWALASADGRRQLRTVWPYAGLLAAAVGYGNMLAYHAQSRLETVRVALQKLSDGVPAERGIGPYLDTLEAAARNVVDMLDAQSHLALAPYGLDPRVAVLLGSALLLAVLVAAARRGASMPLFVCGFTLLAVPLVNTSYGFPLGARYLSFLLPPIYAAVGVTVAGAVEGLRDRGAGPLRIGAAGIATILAVMISVHLLAMRSTARSVAATGETNALVHDMVRAARESQELGGGPVLLSDRIDAKFSGGGHLHRVFATLLGLSGAPYVLLEDDLDDLEAHMDACSPRCVLILAGHHQAEVRSRYALEEVRFGSSPRAEDGETYGLFVSGSR